ncbi:hypothetical protein, partial [Pseudomonas syringae]
LHVHLPADSPVLGGAPKLSRPG